MLRSWYCSEAVISFCSCCTSLISLCRFRYSFLTSVTDSSTSITETLSTTSSSNSNVFSTCVSRVWTKSKWLPAHWTCLHSLHRCKISNQNAKHWYTPKQHGPKCFMQTKKMSNISHWNKLIEKQKEKIVEIIHTHRSFQISQVFSCHCYEMRFNCFPICLFLRCPN